jgi:CMP-N-acetylneuraminic acid synthetase
LLDRLRETYYLESPGTRETPARARECATTTIPQWSAAAAGWMTRLILIPARSGSTRVPNKNLRLLGDKPLLAHVVDSAVRSGAARVVVSTNDDAIAAVARDHGAEVPFRRPPELATANASSLSVVLHALDWLGRHESWRPELVAFCPPTNPFTKPGTLSAMFDRLHEESRVNSIVTITEPRTHPLKIVCERSDGTLDNGCVAIGGKTINDFERSQEFPVVWEGSPACRMTRGRYFESLLSRGVDLSRLPGKTYDASCFVGYRISRLEAMDIDDAEDFELAEIMYHRLKP